MHYEWNILQPKIALWKAPLWQRYLPGRHKKETFGAALVAVISVALSLMASTSIQIVK
jgi:hypothetical protein